MTWQENVTWLGIGLVAAAYVTTRHATLKASEKQLPKAPSAQDEVQPTRWRHDGTQPVDFRDGNRGPNGQAFRTEREIVDVLAF